MFSRILDNFVLIFAHRVSASSIQMIKHLDKKMINFIKFSSLLNF